MRFKKSKQQIGIDISNIIFSKWNYYAEQYSNDLNKAILNKVNETFKPIISNIIMDAFDTLLDSIYTDEEFEKDIGLR